MHVSLSLDGGKHGYCGQESLKSGGGIALAFAYMRHSSVVFSMFHLTKFDTGVVPRGGFRARRVNAPLEEVSCVQRSVLQSEASSKVPFSAMVAGMVSIH